MPTSICTVCLPFGYLMGSLITFAVGEAKASSTVVFKTLPCSHFIAHVPRPPSVADADGFLWQDTNIQCCCVLLYQNQLCRPSMFLGIWLLEWRNLTLKLPDRFVKTVSLLAPKGLCKGRRVSGHQGRQHDKKLFHWRCILPVLQAPAHPAPHPPLPSLWSRHRITSAQRAKAGLQS